jgi:outer membrane protein TolC
MKTACASVAVLLLATTFAFDAQSDEPANPTKTVADQTELGKQLIQTLEEIYKLRLAEYQERGTSDCVRLIDSNRELFEAQLHSVSASQRESVAQRFLARSKEIETIANLALKNGTGTMVSVLEAKASRLRATTELAVISASAK